MPIQIENIEGNVIVASNEHQNQRQNGLGQQIEVQLEDVEVLNNERQNLELIGITNYIGIQPPESDNSQQGLANLNNYLI